MDISLLPLSAFLANLIIGCYILYRDPGDRLNRLFAMLAFSASAWSYGTFVFFNSTTPADISHIIGLTALLSSLTGALMLHFFLAFAENRIVSKRMGILLLYLPAIFFGLAAIITNIIIPDPSPYLWGNEAQSGVIVILSRTYTISYVIAGVFVCLRSFMKAKIERLKKQSRLLTIGISIPLIGGTIAEFVLPFVFRIDALPLSTTLMTITAVFIAYSMVKYGFMIITERVVAEKILDTMSDSVIAVDKSDKISFVNRATMDILDYEENALLGKPLSKIMTSDGIMGFNMSKEISKGLKNFETVFARSDNKGVLMSVSASEIKDKRKNTVGYALVLRDIRETTEIIKALKERTKELEMGKKRLRKSKRIFTKNIGGMKVG